MNEIIIKEIRKEIGVSEKQIQTILELLDEGNTIPFIARYRKEVTGGLDEETITEVFKVWSYQKSLLERKEDVIRLIDERGMLTEELKNEILNATKLVEVEDLYRPYKEKKKTKATEAIKKGLEPLAKWLLTFPKDLDPIEKAKEFVNDDVKDENEALEGAKHIIAEIVSDNPNYRKELREKVFNVGVIDTKVRKNSDDEKEVYANYYDYSEPVSKIKPHRVLAINRGEKEKVLIVKVITDLDLLYNMLLKHEIKTELSSATPYIKDAIDDGLKRLIYPSIEREIRSELTEVAEEQAIEVFSENLKNLLLQAPLKGKVILGVDPAFRTGCKLAVINEQGTFLDKDVIYPHERRIGDKISEEQIMKAQATVIRMINKYKVELIAIGNGTASRETESFIANLIKLNKLDAKFVIVNEAGASVYSASDLAREEFPDFSVEERSAASIARRLQDPLSELVKIDPKSIGVGQYQHDVASKKLNDSLNFVVVNAVNQVGVNVNTASKALLMYVSGLNKSIAENIVKQREKIGKFRRREDLLQVPRLGAKSYEQAIGFLRIPDGDEVLDMTAVHPESYHIAKELMKIYNITSDMFGKEEIKELLSDIDVRSLAKKLNTDNYTLTDIIDAFVAPMRDPRDEFEQPILKSDILQLEDLQVGMELQGTVRNVVDFGVFIDIGLKEDGLLHISKIARRFIKHPSDVLSVGDIVTVYVFGIDERRGKVQLTMLKD